MNRFIVKKESLVRMVELTVAKNPDMKLYQPRHRSASSSLKLRYNGKKAVSVDLSVSARFGKDILKMVDKLSGDIRTNLEKHSGIRVKTVEVQVKDIFDDEKND